MAYTKAGIRFSRDSYVEVDASGGGGLVSGFTLEMKTFPTQMTAGDSYQIGYNVPDNGTVEFVSSASSSKIKISETGLMECIGNSTGACGINIKFKAEDGTVITDVHTSVKVV